MLVSEISKLGIEQGYAVWLQTSETQGDCDVMFSWFFYKVASIVLYLKCMWHGIMIILA